MDKNAQLQTADQTLKGGVIALVSYVAMRRGWEPELIALAIPVVSGVLAAITTLFNNRSTACMFVAKEPKNK